MLEKIETPRLVIRPFEPSDVQAAYRWFSDPVVVRFTATGPDKSVEQTRARLNEYQQHQHDHGFSKWIILNARSGDAIGDSGLLVLPELGWTDLGFRLSLQHWGRGLATEAASAWVRTAFDKLNIAGLGAFVHPDNIASIRVLEKVGFHAERQDIVMGIKAIVFSLHAPERPATFD